MKVLLALLITVGLIIVDWVVSALLSFDVSWILVGITSIWAAIDSNKIELTRYKLGGSWRPIVLFALCNLVWIIVFPWYLWARFKIKAGEAVLREEKPAPVGPVRRFFHRMSRIMEPISQWGLVVLVALKFILLLALIEESWRGPRVWEKYKHSLEAKGQSFDWDAMIPPRVPDSQNFFSAPMMTAWFVKPSGKIAITEDLSKRMSYPHTAPQVLIAEVTVGTKPDSAKADVSFQFDDFNAHQRAKQLVLNIAGTGAFASQGKDTYIAQSFNLDQIKPLHIYLETSKKPNVKELIAFFSGNNFGSGPLSFRPDGSNSWRMLTTLCTASDYLKWSDRLEPEFGRIRDAVKRPFARMDGDYSFPPAIPIPNYANVRAVSQTLAQRAQCYLLLGQPDKALRELTLLNDLRRVLEGAPTGKPMTMVSAMINVAVLGLYVDTIAEGFRLNAWKEPQIAALQNQLEQINLSPVVKEAFHEEEVSAWRIMQSLMSQYETESVPNRQKLMSRFPPYNISRGRWMRAFFDLNMVNVAAMEQPVFESIDPVQKVVLPQKLTEFQREEDALKHHALPYKLFAAIVVPNFEKAVQTFAFGQTKADEAQIVCALERYRLAHGSYPEILNELVPQFISKLPHDIIGGQPLIYRLTSDGRFLLYSIGWNATDDGGQLNTDYAKGDWIWP